MSPFFENWLNYLDPNVLAHPEFQHPEPRSCCPQNIQGQCMRCHALRGVRLDGDGRDSRLDACLHGYGKWAGSQGSSGMSHIHVLNAASLVNQK